jgi:hypothetical protein
MRGWITGARARFIVLTSMLGVAALACNALLDFDSFEIKPTSDAGGGGSDAAVDSPTEDGGGDGGCIDPTGFGGRGCFRCTPTTTEELLNACTASQFEPFDNAVRITGFDPNNPTPELVDGGPTPAAFDAGATTPVDSGVVTVPDCDLTKPNPVIVLGATGFPFDVIAKAMGDEATIFYLEKGSCDGVASMILNTPKAGDGSNPDVVWYDKTSGAATKCRLQEAHPADINLSALFSESCATQSGLPSTNVQLPAGVEDLLGPVNPVMFAVPATSTERVISAEAAYKVYGFGFASGVGPWIDENYIFRRTASSGNQQTVARTLTLPVGGLRGRDSSGSSNMRRALQQSDQPLKTIGISSSEIIDINRDVMKSLAYQHFKQTVGFYPDSDPGGFDRRNVRDGHYYMWIPLHVMVRTSAGDPVAASNAVLEGMPYNQSKLQRDAAVRKLALVMVNRAEAPVPSVDLFGALKKIGNVPQCAMKVTRAREGAPLTPLTPSTKCGCAFEAASPGVTLPECKRCNSPSECGGARPTCSFGFCE